MSTYKATIDRNALFSTMPSSAGSLEPLGSSQIDKVKFGIERLELLITAIASLIVGQRTVTRYRTVTVLLLITTTRHHSCRPNSSRLLQMYSKDGVRAARCQIHVRCACCSYPRAQSQFFQSLIIIIIIITLVYTMLTKITNI